MTATLHTGAGVRTHRGLEGDAVLISNGAVVAVGTGSELASAASSEVAHDGWIVPGMRDTHVHPVAHAAATRGLNLKRAADHADVIARIANAAGELEPGAPLLAHRVDDDSLEEGTLPTRHELDAAAPDRPVLVFRYCGHVAIANSAALALAGIDETTPEPQGGIIDRTDDGTPTGVLRENAMDLVTEHLGRSGPVTEDMLVEGLLSLAGVGLTSIGAMVRTSYGPLGGLGDELGLLAAIETALPLRVHAYVIAATPDELTASKARMGEPSARLVWQGVKAFTDGSFGGHTAAMHDDYCDAPTSGTLLFTEVDEALARRAIELGGDVAFHAIGDRAMTAVIDFFAELVAEGVEPDRLRIEHASTLTGADLDRFGSLGLGAAVQPPFIGSETGWLPKRIGDDRLTRTYPFRSMIEGGGRLSGSSDCPVESPNPWVGMALARHRDGMVPVECLDPTQALALYTSWAAAMLGEPEPLAVGSPADFIVTDRDPVAADDHAVAETSVHEVYVDGVSVPIDPSLDPWPEG